MEPTSNGPSRLAKAVTALIRDEVRQQLADALDETAGSKKVEATELDLETAGQLSVVAFGPANRVLIGVEVRMAERLPDGSLRVRKACWGWDVDRP